MLRAPARAHCNDSAPIDRDLSIGDPNGHARYLGRPLYFGPFDADDPEIFASFRNHLGAAESRGELDATLRSRGLTTKEQWWHIEASFYQRHQDIQGQPASPSPWPRNDNDNDSAGRTTRSMRSPHRHVRGTPMPDLLRMTALEPPVSFEVFCEIAGAQAAWGAAGKNPLDEAAAHFLLEPEELIGAELYWANELASSRELARQFARRILHYKSLFSNG